MRCRCRLTIASIYGYPLTIAAHGGDLEIIECLIAGGAELNSPGDDRNTPLIAAAVAGKSEAVTLLLDEGADVKVRDIHGQSIINLCLDHGEKAISEALVDHHPYMIVNDLRLPKGEAWLRKEYHLISGRAKHATRRPDPALLERVICGDLEPVKKI